MLGNVTVANHPLSWFLKATRDAVCIVLSYELYVPSFPLTGGTNWVNCVVEAAQGEELGYQLQQTLFLLF